MKIGSKKNHKTHTRNHGEFASILEESRWEIFVDKIKPILKIAIPVIAILVFGIWLYSLLKPEQQKADETKVAARLETKDKTKPFAECLNIATVSSTDSISSNHNSEYYQKLINTYDRQLECYGKYPGVNQEGKATVEKLKKEATDKLATLNDSTSKPVTASSVNQGTSSSSIDPETGCSYNLSTSAYSSCVDAYLSKKYQSSSTPTTSGSSESSSQSAYQPTTSSPTVSPPTTSTQPAPTNTQLQECLAAASEFGDPSIRAWHQHDCHTKYGY